MQRKEQLFLLSVTHGVSHAGVFAVAGGAGAGAARGAGAGASSAAERV